jgi:hypothetical protein
VELKNVYFGIDISKNNKKQQHIKHVKPIPSTEKKEAAMKESEVKIPE